MVSDLEPLLATSARRARAKAAVPATKYTERDLVEVATEILHNPKFRQNALRWLNREGGK